MSFDLTRLPRAEIVAALLPGQAIDLNYDGLVRVRCAWPGCAEQRHRNGDATPSALFSPVTGYYRCQTANAETSGWRDTVTAFLGRDAWERYREGCFTEPARSSGGKPDVDALWASLEAEHRWTDLYRIDPDLSRRYLRAGRRLPGEVFSDSVIGIFDQDGKLSGVKFRLPPGRRWVKPAKGGHPDDKYLASAGSRLSGVVFLADRAREGATLVVCAGEKDALVAASHLDPTRWAPVSSCVGECADKVAAKWGAAIGALARGRDVVIAYDGDRPGHAGAWRLARHLEGVATSVRALVLPAPDELPPPKGEDRWDVAAYVLDRGGAALAQLLDAAGPVPESWEPEPPLPGIDEQRAARGDGKARAERQAPARGDGGEQQDAGRGSGGGGEESVANEIVTLAKAHAELFQDLDGTAFVALERNGVRETYPLRSSFVQRWLAAEQYEASGDVPAPSAVAAAVGVLEGQAARCPREAVHVRVANLGERIYLDLGDERWRVVEVTADGWRILDRAPVRFRRKAGMLPLPDPVPGGSIDELWRLLNVPEERDWILVKAWLVCALRGRGPFWALLLQGEQGSAKSSAARLLRNLIDPNSVPIRATPKDVEDLMVAAKASWVTCFDNLSGCPSWLSDALCRLATGGGFSTRQLYTNDDEALFWAQRPIVLNGIDDLATRPDLADRALLVRLPTLPEEDRVEEEELDRRMAEAHPRVLGALLTATSCALRRRPGVKLARLPRMADAARWAVAASEGLGVPDVAIPEILEQNRADQDLVGLEADPVADAVRTLMQRRQHRTWSGSTLALLEDLAEAAGEKATKLRAWPKSQAQLGGRLKRIAPVLRRTGYELREVRQGNERLRVIQAVSRDDDAGE